MRTIYTPEEQIASVHRALRALECRRGFRGQDELTADVRRYLEMLREVHARGELEPVAYDDASTWGQWVGVAALAAGALRLVAVLL